MRCHAVQPLLVAHRDGELARGQSAQVAEHLKRCATCTDLDQELMRTTPEPFLSTPQLTAADEARLSQALDQVQVAPPTMITPLVDLDLNRVWMHLAWAAALLLTLGWGWSNHSAAAALQAQLDAAPAQAETVLDGREFRAASWDPSETESEATH